MNKVENVAGTFLLLFGEMHEKFTRPGEKIARLRLAPAQFHALSLLFRQRSLTISELASELKISKQQTTPLICRLINSGLVVRKADEHDRRVVRIEINEAGKSTFRELETEVKRVFAAKLEVLPDTDLDELGRMIQRIRVILDRVK
jgi:DNA-binding MarR family transcriptional regulator